MKVAVFGLGYVGFTEMCCIASEGHCVKGFDISEAKVKAINNGIPPIVEPDAERLLTEGLAAGRISAYTQLGDHLDDCDMAIVCVGTPSAVDGSLTMTHVAEVSRQIATALRKDRTAPLTVVYRSTLFPGTVERLIAPIFQAELGDAYDGVAELVYNPEFLRESSAVKDYFSPPKIVIGTKDGHANRRMEELNRNRDAPTFYVRFAEAEITKFVDNSWHALKVAFANEIGRICLQLGLSAKKIHEIFVADTKLNISPYYLRPGGAFGGSCLPKDVRALQYMAADCGASTYVIDALLRSNEAHKYRLFQLATEGLEPGASILLVGLAFKAHSDDLRESPNVDLARALIREGYSLSIFDPTINANKLIGANLGYAYTKLPTLAKLLVTKEEIEGRHYDRVIFTNAIAERLFFQPGQDVIDLRALP